ncbi:hypothetical protein KI387_013199, partial [Taxus chinensis]
EHSRLEKTSSDLDVTVVESTYCSRHGLRLSSLKGYGHQINVKAREISASLLGHNTWHLYDSLHSIHGERNFSMQARTPHQRGQKVGLQLSLVSPGILLEPYKPPEPISFLQRWFTRRGWRRTKEALMSELRSAYAIAKLRKLAGYSKPIFYQEAIQHYKEINKFLAQGHRTSLRKLVTENMYSIFKKEIKQREATWSRVHWELIEPAVRIRTLQARMIGVDKDNLDKAFVQLTLEMLTNQKFAAYDLQGNLVAGNIDAK